MEVTRPALRYHGGKFMLARWILSHFPPHRIYCEPFGGAASVLLQKHRSYAEIYNDLDGDIVNFFRVLRDRKDELKQKLIDTPFAREEFKLAYEPTDDSLELARRTVVRSYMGFGSASVGSHYVSGFRSNCRKSGSTAPRDFANYPDAMDAIAERMRGVVIENVDYHKIFRQHDDEESLFYVDPPYDMNTRNSRHAYRFDFEENDHRLLSDVIRSVKGMVVLSGYRSGLYHELYPDWASYDMETYADGAVARTETLWLNPAAQSKLIREPELSL